MLINTLDNWTKKIWLFLMSQPPWFFLSCFLFKTKTKIFYVLGDKLEPGPNLKETKNCISAKKKKIEIYGEKYSKSIIHLTLSKAQVSPIIYFSDWNF
jgi:hypothetical protein